MPAFDPGQGSISQLRQRSALEPDREARHDGFLQRDEWRALSDAGALIGIAVCAVIGLLWAVAGKDLGMVIAGAILLIGSAMAGVYVLDRFLGKAPPPDETGYADGVIRAGVIATMFWGIAGFLVGVIIAWQLAYPALNFDLEWTSFGRLRPLHTSAVIFAFGGNALIATLVLCGAAHLPRAAGRQVGRPGSCSGATSSSSCSPRPAT